MKITTTMKKVLLLLTALFFFSITNAQVGINTTTPDPSSMLDVSATNKGMLIPRMTEVQRTAITTPATGLLVYQTDNTDGFWYYDGASWISLSGNSDNDWTVSSPNQFSAVSGNVGIGTSMPNYKLEVDGNIANHVALINNGGIGGDYANFQHRNASQYAFLQRDAGEIYVNSSDSQNIHFRVDGTDQMFISGTTGNVGVNTTTPNYKLEVNGDIANHVALVNNGGFGASYANFQHRDASQYAFMQRDAGEIYINSNSSQPIRFRVDGTDRMFINGTTGNVGIGTTGPGEKLTVVGNTNYVARFLNTTNANGINIQINTAIPANANNFVTFSNGYGTTVGRIEGETLAELETNDDYILDKTAQDLAIAMATIDVAISGVGIAIATADVTAAATSSSVCIPPICVTSPVPSLIIAASANLAAEIANGIVVSAGLTDAIAYQVQWVNNMQANIGVTYQSGAGDYAEWLPKQNIGERMIPGYVVGVKNGYISLDTKNADKILAISTNPIVLGNSPTEDREDDFEKAAFMGQVPVRVLGKVNTGDYIVPSGNNDGYAKAIASALMTAEDYGRIVGVAWTKSEGNSPVSLINVAMGLNDGDINKVVVKQQNEINDLKAKLAAIDEKLNNILNGDAIGVQMEVTSKENHKSYQEQFQENIPNENQIVYYYVNIEEMKKGLELAEKQFIEAGGNIETHPFWSKIKTDSNFKASVAQKMKQKFDDAIDEFKRLNK